MTIEKGQTWGEPWPGDGPVPNVPVVDGDVELAALLHRALDRPGSRGATAGEEVAALATPRRGDLLRTLGLDEVRPPGRRHRYPVDLGLARLSRSAAADDGDRDDRDDRDGEAVVLPFVAHLTVRNRRLTGLGPGLSVVVMNAAWLGSFRLGPRAHPNDGLLDVTEGTVGLLQRREANRRAVSGSHLPHPGLTTSRTARWQRTWPRPVTVWLDGRPVGRFRSAVVEVVADAGAVVA